jgi:hypothetical protein
MNGWAATAGVLYLLAYAGIGDLYRALKPRHGAIDHVVILFWPLLVVWVFVSQGFGGWRRHGG